MHTCRLDDTAGHGTTSICIYTRRLYAYIHDVYIPRGTARRLASSHRILRQACVPCSMWMHIHAWHACTRTESKDVSSRPSASLTPSSATCTRMYMHMYVCACRCGCGHTHVHAHVCMCMYVCACMHVHVDVPPCWSPSRS